MLRSTLFFFSWRKATRVTTSPVQTNTWFRFGETPYLPPSIRRIEYKSPLPSHPLPHRIKYPFHRSSCTFNFLVPQPYIKLSSSILLSLISSSRIAGDELLTFILAAKYLYFSGSSQGRQTATSLHQSVHCHHCSNLLTLSIHCLSSPSSSSSSSSSPAPALFKRIKHAILHRVLDEPSSYSQSTHCQERLLCQELLKSFHRKLPRQILKVNIAFCNLATQKRHHHFFSACLLSPGRWSQHSKAI